jgi:signal peptidase II
VKWHEYWNQRSFRYFPWLVVAVIVIALDQGSKFWMQNLLEFNNPITMTSWFDLRLAFNTGAAFSFLAFAGGWQHFFFIGLSLTISLGILIAIYLMPPRQLSLVLALQFILGGAIGNFIDRARLGHVIDFIHLHYHDYSWPIFNVADSAICFGAVLWVIATMREGESN